MLTPKNLITVDPKKNRTKLIRLSQNVRTRTKTPSNADAYFESTKIKNPTFLKHCLLEQWCV